MMTPASKHRQRVLAKQQAESAADSVDHMKGASQYELMLAQLAQHKRELKGIQSVEQKKHLKATLIDDYTAYIEGVLTSNAGVQDDVLMTLMVWNIDAGNILFALDIAEYAIKHQLTTPEKYSRDTATLVTEEIAEYAIEHSDSDDILLLLTRLSAITNDQDMPDQVRSKLHKSIGLVLQHDDIQEAVDQLTRALELNPQAGVKKLRDQLQKRIEKDTKETPDN